MTSRPACPTAVDLRKPGIFSYGIRVASVNSSANAPSPEPKTSAIFGRSFVFEKMNFAALFRLGEFASIPRARFFFAAAAALIDSMIPTIDADIRFAIVPATIARMPSRARSAFLFGASAPIPPI